MTLITINKPKTTAAVTAINTNGPKDSAVFASIKCGRGFGKRRVSPWMTYGEALVRFSKLDQMDSTPGALGAGGGPVQYLAVRSKADPKWNASKRATVVRRDKSAAKGRSAARAL